MPQPDQSKIRGLHVIGYLFSSFRDVGPFNIDIPNSTRMQEFAQSTEFKKSWVVSVDPMVLGATPPCILPQDGCAVRDSANCSRLRGLK